jgi:hypothetical protein
MDAVEKKLLRAPKVSSCMLAFVDWVWGEEKDSVAHLSVATKALHGVPNAQFGCCPYP